MIKLTTFENYMTKVTKETLYVFTLNLLIRDSSIFHSPSLTH